MRPLSASQRETLEEATRAYQDQLTVAAVQHLQGRGLGKAEADTFRLGVVVDPYPGHSKYRGMVAIPYLDRDGRPLSIRFRCLEEHNHRDFFHGKYNTVKDEPARCYNIGAIHRAGDEIHVTEGEFDAIVLNKIGLPAVAFPGANNFKPRHRRMLAGFSRIWVWGDPDDAGAEFTNRICRSLRQAKGVRLTEGDVTETYMAAGQNADVLLAALNGETNQ
ncbi:toprim domain-containing protein [Micromonospora sp. A200]|uniref:toprim domain-containing protein n=1 Tax=Micromonospora sp. A200 TaxID=2940568 RepID=UPI0024752C2B|nr:toprim domain-containing protein [Micromonospora sp. A200]